MTIKNSGYTIVELIIAIVVATVLAGVLFVITINYYGAAFRAEATTQMALESQAFLLRLVEDTKLAGSIGSTNLIDDSNGPAGGWTTNDPSNILIIREPATDVDRNIIYDSLTGYPYYNEFIYFLDGPNMYKRVLKNENASGNTAITTCPPAVANASCPTDRLFSDKVSNLTFVFYDHAGTTTADAGQAKSIDFSVDMETPVFGEILKLANSIHVTLRNQ
ncbi:MAG TPA: type II secretion system protein [Candidatus Saccharimonadales bacterium]